MALIIAIFLFFLKYRNMPRSSLQNTPSSVESSRRALLCWVAVYPSFLVEVGVAVINKNWKTAYVLDSELQIIALASFLMLHHCAD